MLSATSLNYRTSIHNPVRPLENSDPVSHHRPEFLHLPLLKRCTSLIHLKQIHAQIIKTASHHTDSLLAKLVNSLLDSSQMNYARQVFEEMSEPSTFVFNTMARANALGGSRKYAIELYIQMRFRGLEPDHFTFPILLRACAELNQGKGVHSLILKDQSFSSDIYSQTALIDFYSRHGNLECARLVFDKMPERNVVSWTAMITGYMKQKRYNEGLALFHQMQIAGVEINELTLVNVLSACAKLGAFEMGKWVHGYIDRNRIFLNPTLAAALIDMYVKCGYINEASQVFEKVPERSVSSWNSIIGGLAMHGHGEEALDKFKDMLASGTRPDEITFIGVLSACNHSLLVDKGRECFNSIKGVYGQEPNIKHYGCLVDLLGRSGNLDEAYKVIKEMPIEPNGVLWGSLLNACKRNANVYLAEIAMEQLVELEPFNDGNYVLMSNIYAAKLRWDNVAKVRNIMKDRGILKTPGCSSIEMDNTIHQFMAGDCRHPHSKEIYSMLDDVAERLKAVDFVPRTSQVLLDANEEEKRRGLCHHSEKLAIAFGLLRSSPGTPIRVMKNLRACSDCHLATKLISKIYSREIIVRDRTRFHHFKDGACSCNDSW
ncbi:hypothetical protein NE237_021572 [Protea cynaroides]|uniref:DYW domain-containing protein n=1 Tax=Protea cynaroides TaxID=273540 RepID=A0A9Q0HCM4_9MAGN|nr:hypothetical protein NE237_021572 [Protea cynaroides]